MDGTGRLAAFVDPMGFHPLAYAITKGLFAVASETVAFDNIRLREGIDFVSPGELLVYENGKLTKNSVVDPHPSACPFEKVYFMRIPSRLQNGSVYSIRKQLGQKLADTEPLRQRGDFKDFVVIAVPDTAKPAAESYARSLGLQFDHGAITKDTYVGRAFITSPGERPDTLWLKYNVVTECINSKIIIFDDSMVRGDAAQQVIARLINAGAQEIHFRLTFPPIMYACKYGIDFPNTYKLIAHQIGDYSSQNELETKIAQRLGIASVRFIPREDLLAVVGNNSCTACFDGRYHV